MKTRPSSDLRNDGPAASTADKIKELKSLASILAEHRATGKRVVHCHGVFDLLHLGHIRHFEEARRAGDILVVTLTPDQWVNKGPHRPAFPQDLRAETVASLQCVDYVAINHWPTAIETIKFLRPDIYAKGAEYREMAKDVTGGIQAEYDAVREIGGTLLFTEDIVFSSSTLINRHMSLLTKEANEFISTFGTRRKAEDLIRYINGAKPLKVLVVGETILDEYHYCETLGKAGKEPILAVRYRSTEKFAGGSLAVANHLASFSDRIGLASFRGSEDEYKAFIQEKLNPRVDPLFFTQPNIPTIVKRRYVEFYPFQKLFEVYHMEELDSDSPSSSAFRETLAEILPKQDLVIVADYGHGLLDDRAVDLLARHAPCLAVNTQANAGNLGFNTISKYPRADYVCISEQEMRLEARRRHEDLRKILERVAAKMGCRTVMVTRGRSGSLCYNPDEGFISVPALVSHFTDRVGAGDALLAITALMVAQKAPLDIMGMIGNAVGAMAVGVVGNRSPIDRTALIKFIISLMK